MLSTEVIDGLLEFTPGALVVDALGSTEGGMAQKLVGEGCDRRHGVVRRDALDQGLRT